MAVDSASAGWYPSEHGVLRYWDGTAWTDHYASAPPASSNPVPAERSQRAQVIGVVAVGLIVCLVLVALVWGMNTDVLLDDSQPVITLTPSVP